MVESWPVDKERASHVKDAVIAMIRIIKILMSLFSMMFFLGLVFLFSVMEEPVDIGDNDQDGEQKKCCVRDREVHRRFFFQFLGEDEFPYDSFLEIIKLEYDLAVINSGMKSCCVKIPAECLFFPGRQCF